MRKNRKWRESVRGRERERERERENDEEGPKNFRSPGGEVQPLNVSFQFCSAPFFSSWPEMRMKENSFSERKKRIEVREREGLQLGKWQLNQSAPIDRKWQKLTFCLVSIFLSSSSPLDAQTK